MKCTAFQSVQYKLNKYCMLARSGTCTSNIRRAFVSTSSNTRKMLPVPWFHATDIPKSKPYEPDYISAKLPEKFMAFTKYDSKRIEQLYQKTLNTGYEAEEGLEEETLLVNEDHLFEVNILKKELNPVFWEGPGYEIRRGLWFNANGCPLPEDLTEELEANYSEVNFMDDGSIKKGSKDLFNLKKTYKEGSLSLYLDSKSVFLLADISGGQMQLQYLRSSLAQSIPINAIKAIRGVDNLQSKTIKTPTSDLISTELSNKAKQFRPLSEILKWQLTDVLGSKGQKDEKLEYHSNISDDELLKNETENDYNNNGVDTSTNQRDVEHLIFCVHGIGQSLGKKYEYVNFAHNINILRNNIKSLYSKNSALQDINKENKSADWEKNCNVQVLPITWRHNIGFDTETNTINKESPELPSLSDITVNGILPLRKLLGDVGLDILLYDDPHYKEIIMKSVQYHLNRTYQLYIKKNPNFKGKVHLVGHSLGSLISFDILSNPENFKLDFDIQNYFNVGSPVGVFKLVQKTKIGKTSNISDNGILYATPTCKDLYNVFHVCDPVAYRMEPLIDTSLKACEQVYLPHFDEGALAYKMLEMGGNLLKDFPTQEKFDVVTKDKPILTQDVIDNLKSLNYSGRIDYSLTPNFLDVDMISAIKSHVSYFEDIDIAGFILRETIAKHIPVDKVNFKRLRKATSSN